MNKRIKTTMDMDYNEFVEWAEQHIADGIMEGGFKEMRRRVRTVIQQESMIFSVNGGFQKDTE